MERAMKVLGIRYCAVSEQAGTLAEFMVVHGERFYDVEAPTGLAMSFQSKPTQPEPL